MKKTRVLIVFVCMMTAVNFASADNIRGIDINFVTIGHAGNASDVWSYGEYHGCGAVGYNYRIGKYEVTNAQWNTFTAAAGAPTGSDGGYGYSSYWTGAQQPTNNVNWYEAAQFCNYLTSGDKSKGAYKFSGNNTNPGNFLGIDRTASVSAYRTTYVIPTEDEWYKAAYFKPDGSGYSLYANGTNTAPSTSDACYNQGQSPRSNITGPWNIGSGTQEQNGTFDMMGNVWEWNEGCDNYYPIYRVMRGGSYLDAAGPLKSLSGWRDFFPSGVITVTGFRVAEIPEPASAAIMTLAGLFIALKRKQR